jgi:hypothetical protein
MKTSRDGPRWLRMLLIRYNNGRVLEGFLLALGDQKIRVALKDSDDVTEYRLVSQRWVSEDCEVVTMGFEHEASEIVEEDEFMESMILAGFDRPVARHLM